MKNRTEPLCHVCGLHTDICSLVEGIARIATKVTAGNFQVHLAEGTVKKFLGLDKDARD